MDILYPKSLDVHLQGLTKIQTDKILQCVDYILHYLKRKDSEFTLGIQSELVQDLCGSRLRKCSDGGSQGVVQYLAQAGVLAQVGSYAVGSHCKQYKWLLSLRGEPKRHTLQSSIPVKRHTKWRDEILQKSLNGLADLTTSAKTQVQLLLDRRVSLDQRYYKTISHLDDCVLQVRRIESLLDGTGTCSQKPFELGNVLCSGRLYSPITYMSRIIRPYLHLDGRDVSEIDISACSPTILAGCTYSDLSSEADYRLFRGLCERGELYQYLRTETGHSVEQAKKSLQVYLNDSPLQPTKVSCAFEEAFPSVSQWLTSFKHREGQGAVFRLTSHHESEIVLGVVSSLINDDIPAVSVHDAVLVPADHVELARQKLTESFQSRLGITPHLKVDE